MPDFENQQGLYTACVIGCGLIGSQSSQTSSAPGVHSHAAAFKSHPRTKLIGVADTDAEKLRMAASYWNVEGERDAVSLCSRLRPEIISLCTPDETHFALAQSLLENAPPRVLFIEKPMTLKADEAEKLLALAEDVGCAIAVNHSRRFSPAFRALKNELEEGKHGKPLLARFIYGKGLLHNGGHALDLLRFWLGEPTEVSGAPVAWGPAGDETYNVDLRFANDCRARLEGFDERVATVFELDFLTEKSRWRFWLGGHAWEFSAVSPSPLYSGYFNYLPTGRETQDALFAAPLADSLFYAVENIVGFLDGKESLLSTGADGLAVLRLIEKIRRTG